MGPVRHPGALPAIILTFLQNDPPAAPAAPPRRIATTVHRNHPGSVQIIGFQSFKQIHKPASAPRRNARPRGIPPGAPAAGTKKIPPEKFHPERRATPFFVPCGTWIRHPPGASEGTLTFLQRKNSRLRRPPASRETGPRRPRLSHRSRPGSRRPRSHRSGHPPRPRSRGAIHARPRGGRGRRRGRM